ncbi:MAG: 3-dehydroquinate synthase [Saprospiraceae bacterium]
MQSIQLADYTIPIGNDFSPLNELIRNKQYTKIVVLVDENTAVHCLPILKKELHAIFEIIQIPAGEQHKNIQTCQLIWTQMMQLKLSRKALCINLGGGVIGDMGGFCASTFKRGMDFVQIPTTLLSQVDASIGGKLGIDFMQVKNSIGVFNNPQMVLVNPDFLKTLSKAEIRSGFAEIIKHSLIADGKEWQRIQKMKVLEEIDWTSLIEPSLQIKKQVVETDPFEHGLRKALNFGHTIGHALEGYALETEQPLLHGEAIAIGMVCEAYLSHVNNQLSEKELMDIVAFFKHTYDYWAIPLEAFDAFIALMRNDKKNKGSEINFSFIPKAGTVKVNQTADEEQIRQSFYFYNEMAR